MTDDEALIRDDLNISPLMNYNQVFRKKLKTEITVYHKVSSKYFFSELIYITPLLYSFLEFVN